MGEAYVFITNDTLRQALHETIDRQRERITMLEAELNAALDALRAAPYLSWKFRPTIGWLGAYFDWYEAQKALGQTEV